MASAPRKTGILDSAALFLFAVAVHVPYLLGRPFFFADDFGLLADADNLTSGATRFLDVPAWGVWRLGQRALWWAGYRVFGLDPLPYAWLSVLLHGACVVALAALLRRLGWQRGAVIAGAAVFATLSVPALAVRYMVQDAVLVAAVLVIFAAIAHDAGRVRAATLLFLAGALFYEQALCAPLVFAAVNVWRRRRPFAGLAAPVGAAAAFVAVNLWTLRHATKIFAYNTAGFGADALRQIVFAPWLAAGVPPGFSMRAFGAALLLAATAAILIAAFLWLPARGVLLGIALAWIAALPYAGRNVGWWPPYYFYLPGAGLAAAVAAPRIRLWPLACVPLVLWNVRGDLAGGKATLAEMRRYEQVTRETPPQSGVPFAVFVNVNSGLAWAGWQFGGSLRAFELWDAPAGPARCYTGNDLDEVRARMRRDFPAASRRGRWPEDRPPALRGARPPARRRLFPWPPRIASY
ncbi:MAG TPA: hypothetical protein VIA45_11315 [Thermoanaerobaculia bacterium]|jgi:hypothetical protein